MELSVVTKIVYSNALSPNQCDQIERFYKVLGIKITYKSNPNIWQLFGLF